MFPVSMTLLLVLSACDGTEGDASIQDTRLETCDVRVDAASPANGAVDAYYRDSVVFTLSAADGGATITAPVEGTTTRDASGERLTFIPDAPLTPSTDYTFTLEYCGGSVDLSFRTSEIGSEPVNTELDGRAWTIPLEDGVAYGLSATTAGYLRDELILGASTVDGASIELTLDTADAWCGAASVTGSFAHDPFVEVTFGTIQLELAGYVVPLYDAAFAGTFSGDGTTLIGTLTGSLETRELGALVDSPSDEHTFCEAVEYLGESCQACPDGELLCFPLQIHDLVGTERSLPACP
jgi:hypothetical protein